MRQTKGLPVSRRTLLGASAAVAATTTASAWSWNAIAQEVEALKAKGWEAHPVACHMCGARCGMLALHQPGQPFSRETIRIVPNPDHPQRGYCGRGAQTMWMWDHPLRIKTPLKRKGERGSGEFEAISWDQALTEISQKLKTIIDRDGVSSVVLTTHNFGDSQKWLALGLGLPNMISHSSTCNSPSNLARRLVVGKGHSSASAVEPDYANVRYLLMMGRTLNCAAGVFSTLSAARDRGARIVFVDPRMPEGALSEAEWIGIRPGTDAAFLHGLIHVGLAEDLCDLEWMRKYSNAPYLVTEDGQPVTEDRIKAGGRKDYYAVMDETSQGLVWVGVVKDEKGSPQRLDEPANLKASLSWTGELTAADGQHLSVMTAMDLFRSVNAKYTPQHVTELTGIPTETIVKTARDFFTLGGVCDDGWYSTRNGNDVECFMLANMINYFTGQLDRKGGLVFCKGGGYKGPAIQKKGTKCTGLTGETWEVSGDKALDKIIYPEGSGTLSAVFEAIETGKPYPVKALFITGSSLFHREANSDRLAKALKGLELVVSQDLMPHEANDYADYVLPSTFFMESLEYGSVKYALEGWVHRSEGFLMPPEGVEARDDAWQMLEILRRVNPERAAKVGYAKEIKTLAEWRKWWDETVVEGQWKKFVAKKNAEKPGSGDALAKAMAEHGYVKTGSKVFDQIPYKKPMTTPTGKAEIVSFYQMKSKVLTHMPKVAEYVPISSFKTPKPMSNEFIIASGKDGSACAGTTLFTHPSRFIGDRTLWMNPVDAKRLGISNGEMIQVEGLDNGLKAQVQVSVTNRVKEGVLFHFGFSGGVRTKNLLPQFEWVREGLNTHWFGTGVQHKGSGSLSNNVSVRVSRL